MPKRRDPLTKAAIAKVKKEQGGTFSTVRAARTILQERAEEFIKAYYALATQAAAEGKHEVAEKIIWNLIDHAPADEDGVRIIDSPASKPQVTQGNVGPTIQIGLALGGMEKPKALPEVTTIDVKPEPK